MTKRGLLAAFLVVTVVPAFALQVDKNELSKGQGKDIQFINYVGPHSIINTIAQIVGIGQDLGANVSVQTQGTFNYAGKYRVIHAVTTTEPDKLDADIFIIEKSAEVDDIVNVMRIVSGYLEAAYAYSPSDAVTLARFVVYYNAVYRGDMAYIRTTYKSAVLANVDATNVGIATRYNEWPGNTRMLIPLNSGAAKGNLSSVGSLQLSAPKVIENLQQTQPDKGVPQRKSITELQQRGIEQGQQKVEQQKQQITQQEQNLAQSQQKLQAEQQSLQQQKAAAGTEPTQAQQQAIAAQEKSVTQQQQKVQQQAQQVQQQKQQVAQQEQQLSQAQKQVQQERSSIANDQLSLLNQKPTPPPTVQPPATSVAQPGRVLFIYDSEGSGDHLGELVAIDRVSGKLLAKSALNTIRNKRYETLQNLLLVLAGRTGRGGSVRLVTLDPQTLDVVSESDAPIAATSGIAVDGQTAYAVVEKNGADYLASFGPDLKLAAQSDTTVDPYSYITVSGQEVFVQDTGGNILILNKSDLKEEKKSGA